MLGLWVVSFFHSGSIITRGWVRWKGKVGVGTICFMYVSCMFRFLVYFSVFSCRNCGIVRIAEGTEDAEDTEGRRDVRIAGLSESLKSLRTQRDTEGRGECQNCGIVRITEVAEDTEDTEDIEGRGLW